jgi:hypothetical protein
VTKANSQEFLSAHCYQKINIPLYINLPRYMKQSVTPSITQTSTPWFYGKERPKLNLLLLLVVYSQQWLNKMKACPTPWILAFGKATFVTLNQICSCYFRQWQRIWGGGYVTSWEDSGF